MKIKSLILLSALCTAFIFSFSSCVKDPDEPAEETPTPVAAPPAKFTWAVNTGSNIYAEEMYFVPSFSNIYATKSNGSSVDISLEDLDQGTHAISSANGITLEYITSTSTLNATSGTVFISENTGVLLSGTFTCALAGGGVSSNIKGEFMNIPKK